MLVGCSRPHHIGFRRIGIGCPGIARHRLDGGTDDHHVRARLDPMVARLGFGRPRVGVARPGVTVEHINEAHLIGRWCMGLPRLRPLYGVGVHAHRHAVVFHASVFVGSLFQGLGDAVHCAHDRRVLTNRRWSRGHHRRRVFCIRCRSGLGIGVTRNHKEW
jgi:hypothetical protein